MTNFEMQALCQEEINRCMDIAKGYFPKVNFRQIKIYWGTSVSMKTVAGLASYRDNSIELNGSIMARNCQDFINRTPAHEVAHLVAYQVYGACATGKNGHGEQWKSICDLFSISNGRYHNYRCTGEIYAQV